MDEVWGQASGSATQPEHLLARPEGQLVRGPRARCPSGLPLCATVDTACPPGRAWPGEGRVGLSSWGHLSGRVAMGLDIHLQVV